MQEKELQQAIQKLLEENEYEMRIERTIAHPAVFHLLNKEATDLILSTIKFDVAIVKKITTNEVSRP